MTSLPDLRVRAHPQSTTPLSKSQDKTPPGPDGAGRSRHAPAGPGGEPPLGTTAKYSAALSLAEQVSYENRKFDAAARRMERFALQAAARKILPNARTAHCLRNVQKSKEIQVWQSREHGTCSFKGLQTCGSVWACSVCSAKISERRRVELQTAIALHTAAGGQVLMATFTTPHYLGDQLDLVLAGQARALGYLYTDRASRKVFQEMGCIGKIRALEVTHGRLRAVNNGWHPHYHVLLFVRSGLDLTRFRHALWERWTSACVKAGLKAPSLQHGIRLDDGTKAAKYASKWGLESEMTKGHTKKALDGETPFDLLRAYLGDGDRHAAVLFREFAEAFKGKRQLHWSSGLKKLFGIGEVTDDELVAGQDDIAAMLGTISVEQWRLILKADARGLVLELASNGGAEAMFFYIDGLTRKAGCDGKS